MISYVREQISVGKVVAFRKANHLPPSGYSPLKRGKLSFEKEEKLKIL
jgi:hypothetical protein